MPKSIRYVDDVPNRNLEEYKIYVGMISRCFNREDAFYKDYGGKGIKVCRRWVKSFDNFLADVGRRPKNYWLILIRKDRNYCKSNCVWIAPADLNRKRMKLRRKAAAAQSPHSSAAPRPAGRL